MSSSTVLLIEADDGDARLMEGIFSGAGYQVMRASEGRAGIELARSADPALIMLAVELPGLSGYKACRDIKQDPALSTIPLIITSSTATEDTFAQHRTFKTRADEYLHKPLDPGDLRATIARFIALDAAVAAAADDEDDVLFAAADGDDDELGASMFLEPGEDDALEAGPDTGETTAVLDEELLEYGGGADELLSIDADLGDAFGDGGIDLAGVLDDLEVGSDVLEVADDFAAGEFLDEVEVDAEESAPAPEAEAAPAHFEPPSDLFDPPSDLFDAPSDLFEPVSDMFEPQADSLEPEPAMFEPEPAMFEPEPAMFEPEPERFEPEPAMFEPVSAPAFTPAPPPAPFTAPPAFAAPAASAPPPAPAADASQVHAELAQARSELASLQAELAAARDIEATQQQTIDRLADENQALQAQVAELSTRLGQAGEALKAEFDAMKAKLEHARTELHDARASFYHFATTLQAVLGEKADELRAFGPFPELPEP